MEGNKFCLEKTEIKETRKGLVTNLEMLAKKLKDVEAMQSCKRKLPKADVLVDITVVKKQNAVKMGPKYTAMAGGDIQKTGVDFKKYLKSELCIADAEGIKKRDNSTFHGLASSDAQFEVLELEPFHCQTPSSRPLTPLPSTCDFLDSRKIVQKFKHSKPKEESNLSIKQRGAELRNKVFSDNFVVGDASFLNKPMNEMYLSEKHKSSFSPLTNNKMIVCDSIKDQKGLAIKKYFDDGDVETDSSEKAKQQHSSSLSLPGEEIQIKELREAIERSVIYLLNYLEALENRTQMLENNLEKLISNPKAEGNICNNKYNEENINLERGDNISEASFLSTSSILKYKSNTSANDQTHGEARLVDIDTCESLQKQPSDAKSCSCDCCNGRCLHFQSARKIFNDQKMDVEKVGKNKITSSNPIRQGFLNTFEGSNATVRKSQVASKQDFLCFGLSDLVTREPHLVTHEGEKSASSSTLVHTPSAADNLLFQSCTTASEKSSEINREKCRKRNKESECVCCGKNQLEQYDEDQKIIDDKDYYDRVEVLFIVLLCMIAIATFFIMLMFVFI